MAGVALQWRDRVYAVVREIPRGRVASYGLVAMLAGRPGAARAVGNVMLGCEDPSVPCHRVVHADGALAPSFARQRARLRREEVTFRGARVDVRERLWAPRLPGVDRAGATDRAPARRVRGGVRGSSKRTIRKDSPAL